MSGFPPVYCFCLLSVKVAPPAWPPHNIPLVSRFWSVKKSAFRASTHCHSTLHMRCCLLRIRYFHLSSLPTVIFVIASFSISIPPKHASQSLEKLRSLLRLPMFTEEHETEVQPRPKKSRRPYPPPHRDNSTSGAFRWLSRRETLERRRHYRWLCAASGDCGKFSYLSGSAIRARLHFLCGESFSEIFRKRDR